MRVALSLVLFMLSQEGMAESQERRVSMLEHELVLEVEALVVKQLPEAAAGRTDLVDVDVDLTLTEIEIPDRAGVELLQQTEAARIRVTLDNSLPGRDLKGRIERNLTTNLARRGFQIGDAKLGEGRPEATLSVSYRSRYPTAAAELIGIATKIAVASLCLMIVFLLQGVGFGSPTPSKPKKKPKNIAVGDAESAPATD